MTSEVENTVNLLAGLEEFIESSSTMSEVFSLNYRGSSEIDRHYTKPMLPWIIAEIKNQNRFDKVRVEVCQGIVNVLTIEGQLLFSHSVKQIHKCVMERTDHTHFLYTLKPTSVDNEVSSDVRSPSSDHQCHLFKAENEEHVRNFFHCLRQQPRDPALQRATSYSYPVNCVPDLTMHNDSQVYEVLFVGRVKVSHSKVPSTFIDEACDAFSKKKKTMDTFSERSPVTSYQSTGSGFSVPNINLSEATEDTVRSRSSSKEFAKGELCKRNPQQRVRFSIDSENESRGDYGVDKQYRDSSLEQSEDVTLAKSPINEECNEWNSLAQLPQKKSMSDSRLAADQQKEIRKLNAGANNGESRELYCYSDKSVDSSAGCANMFEVDEGIGDMKGLPVVNKAFIDFNEADELKFEMKEKAEGSEEVLTEDQKREASDFFLCPPRQRLRTISGGSTPSKLKQSVVVPEPHRSRANSIGSARSRLSKQMSESELKVRQYVIVETCMGSSFNRTMLFHIGKEEIKLINAELKTVQLHKSFKVITQRCQGVRCSDHFGFICREVNEDTLSPVYVGYVFRCDSKDVTNEIFLSLNKAFEVVQTNQHKEKKENSTCDSCPMKWFSLLCSDLEGLPAVKAHAIILKRMTQLPENERALLVAKYEGADAPEVTLKNNVLMMLLRAHMEDRQTTHVHNRGAESSLDKMKKSLTSSFQNFLKREPGGGVTLEDTGSESSTPNTTPAKGRMEGVSESPLVRSQRPRSSTLSSMGGDAMRREFRNRQRKVLQPSLGEQPPQPMSKEVEAEVLSGIRPVEDEEGKENTHPMAAKRNIFLKVGSTAGDASETSPPSPSFRHTIMQRVTTPRKDKDESIPSRHRGWCELRLIWRRAVFRQMVLNRMEREVRQKRALAEELEVQRLCLGYPEEELPQDTVDTWLMILSRPSVKVDSSVLWAGVKRGVPKELRGDIWQLLMSQYPPVRGSLPPSYETSYDEMIKGLTSQQHAILIDLGRTFPNHPYFTRTLGPGQLGLFNLLKAYSRLDGEVGYCQGLSFIAGILLMHVGEAPSYSLLKHLMFASGVRRQFREDLDGLQVQMYQLSRLLHDNLSSLYRHLEESDVSPQLYAAPWFLTLFASTFPLHFVVRVYDMLFLMGLQAVFRISLVLLKMNQEKILECEGFEETMTCLRNEVTHVKVEDLENIFEMAFEEDISAQLSAYEVEYQVLREELAISPPKQRIDIDKLTEERKNLKRQNLDLLEQLQNTQAQKQALENSNQMLQQNQHHLEVRVRFLEVERSNLQKVVKLLWSNGPDAVLEELIPQSLKRYLPGHEASPQRQRLRSESIPGSFSDVNPHIAAAEVLGEKNSRTNQPRRPSEIGLFGSKLEHSPFPSFNIFGSKESSGEDAHKPVQRTRSSTLDQGSMQRFVRGLTRNT